MRWKTEKFRGLVGPFIWVKTMVEVYPKEYVEKYELISKQWDDSTFPNAKQLRDTEARQLRKEGWEVETKKLNFVDLARCYVYTLKARKLR